MTKLEQTYDTSLINFIISTCYPLGDEEEKGGQGQGPGPGGDKVLDLTDKDLVNLRRTLYLTIMSSVSFE